MIYAVRLRCGSACAHTAKPKSRPQMGTLDPGASPAQTAAATPSAGEIASRWTARSGFRGREWATYRSALLPGPTDQSCDQINLLAGGKGSRSGLRCAVDGISNLWTFGEA